MQFKGFRIGKSKEKNEKTETKNPAGAQAAVLEEPLGDNVKKLKQNARQLNNLSSKSGSSGKDTDIHVRPHGPIGELKVGDDDDTLDKDSSTDENDSILTEENGEKVKLFEVSADVTTSLKAKAAAAPKDEPTTAPKAQATTPPKAEAASPAKEDKTKPGDADDLNKLFTSEEEEENPLANLIRSMPDVTTEELLEDLKEIKEIIREWQQK